MAAGTMIELVAARDDIDTTDTLHIFEAYEKVLVINGANLKIADFANTKLTITALTTAPSRDSIVTQATSNATMKVDFVNTAKTEIYGRTISGTFVTTGGYTLSGGGMDPATRVPSAVDEATDTPHWYDYTVYPGGTFGVMPTKAYLGCLYYGSVFLAGDPTAPQQWYMARQANMFDYNYISLDAQSPVTGGNADAGKVGDIIRALIPYRDEYLVFGCADSIYYLVGNPAAGGVLDELDITVGVFGAKSWCFDGEANLYFWGTNGIYKTRIPQTPENISGPALPKLVKDEGIDPTTHRITMEYDRLRKGILITITVLATGVNSNYFYNLSTNGFFPETYPDECGAYSLFHYNANDSALRDLLVGCKDGYIRHFDDSATDDDIGGSDTAIDSNVVFGPVLLGESKEGREGVISAVTGVTTGGKTGGTILDSSNVAYKAWAGLSSDEVVEKAAANTNPNIAGTFSAPGRNRGARRKHSARGIYGAVRLSNSTAGETWGLEHLLIDGAIAGKAG